MQDGSGNPKDALSDCSMVNPAGLEDNEPGRAQFGRVRRQDHETSPVSLAPVAAEGSHRGTEAEPVRHPSPQLHHLGSRRPASCPRQELAAHWLTFRLACRGSSRKPRTQGRREVAEQGLGTIDCMRSRRRWTEVFAAKAPGWLTWRTSPIRLHHNRLQRR